MNTQEKPGAATCKVIAPTSRQALRLIREALGPDAIILSSTVMPEGVEIVATLEEPSTGVTVSAMPIALAVPSPAVQPSREKVSPGAAAFDGSPEDGDNVLREIHSMRGMIEEQLAGFAWNEAQRRDPLRGQLLRALLGAGFSARLAKEFLVDLPIGQNHAHGMDYVKSAMARRMPMLEDEDALMNEGGVYALMGPTGVGKTTTTAKLAARCVMRFGPAKLALVTTDSYRIGAFEQLRIYGQILGVSVHAVKDAADLERVLSDLRDKHMVLVDTVGMSQRDRAVSDQIAMLCGASRPVKRLLLLNASSHGDTLNEVVHAYRSSDKTAKGTDLAGCIFTKVDEATHPGALIDTVIRHQLPVYYVSSGQKVPEHLMLGSRSALIDSAFQARSQSAWFVPGEADLEEQPAAERHEAKVTAAAAVNERLRSQCQQLIRALAHDARELTANASALSTGQIGFDETRVLWRRLAHDQTGGQSIEHNQFSQACSDIKANCTDYVLATSSEISLDEDQGCVPGLLVTALLSDRNGLPFGSMCNVQQQKFDKQVVHLFARVPALPDESQATGLQWASHAPATLRIVMAENDTSMTLAKWAAGLVFSAQQAVIFRGKPAFQSVAEANVRLRQDENFGVVADAANSRVLRCVVRRIVDVESGKSLSHSYVLASSSIRATASQIAKWGVWRAAAEPYFKLFRQSMIQLADTSTSARVPLSTRLLVAGQAATSVFRLQNTAAVWAETARKVLAQLAGRSTRPDRPVPGAVLLEGLGKLCVLLDALETDGTASLQQADPAPLKK